MGKPAKPVLKPTNEKSSTITLNVSNKIKEYIKTQTSNYSEWVKDAGHELLNMLYNFCLPNLKSEVGGSNVISISKPDEEDLEDIYNIVSKYKIFLSRSEAYRFAVVWKIMISSIKNHKYEDILRLEQEDRKRGIIRVSSLKENGEEISTIYKVLRKLEY